MVRGPKLDRLQQTLAELEQRDLTDVARSNLATAQAAVEATLLLNASIEQSHQAIRDLRQAMRIAEEQIRVSAKGEARKHLAHQLAAAAEALRAKP